MDKITPKLKNSGILQACWRAWRGLEAFLKSMFIERQYRNLKRH
ncbi:hypothetical protein [Methanosarcina mazei]|nr:hypothetical protein [Methanosarcina mazei]